MSNKLKPCPFCGKIPTIELYKDEWYGIVCENEKCKIQPHTAWLKKRATVIREWNNRVSDEQEHFRGVTKMINKEKKHE